MNLRLSLLVLGALLLTRRGLAQKGAFEQILDVNLGKGWFAAKIFHLRQFVRVVSNLCYIRNIFSLKAI